MKRTWQILLILMAASVATASTPAIEAILAQPQIDLADLFRLAELTNPGLAAARAGNEAEAGRARQTGAYPNPELTVAVEDLSLDDSSLHTRKVELMQPLIVGGRRGAAIDAAQASLQSSTHDLRQSRRAVLRRVHELWAEQLYFREAEVAFAELLAVANRSLEIARARFDARAEPESHVTKALLEVYELEVAQQRLAQQRARGTAEFAAFFGGVTVPLDRMSGSLDPDPDETMWQADAGVVVGEHPALRAAHLRITAAEATAREARSARIPDLGVFVGYGNNEPTNEEFLEAGVSLPLPLFDRGGGRVAEARSLVTQAEYEARMVENELTVALADAHQRHETTHLQLDAVTERIAPAAARGLEQAQEAYRVGRLMFLELVDAQRTFTDVRLRTLELRRDLALSEAEWMSLVGTGPYADPKGDS